MKKETLAYIERCAVEYDNASIQKLSTKDVRDLLTERADLLAALKSTIGLLKGHQESPDKVTRYQNAVAVVAKAQS